MNVADQALEIWAAFERCEIRPSMSMVVASMRAANISFRTDTVRDALRDLAKAAPHPKSRAMPGVPRVGSGYANRDDGVRNGSSSGAPSCDASGADHNRVVKAGGEYQESISPPPPTQPEAEIEPVSLSQPVAMYESPAEVAAAIEPAAQALFAVPQPPVDVKPVKAKRIVSAYAGTTLESFGELLPLVTAVLAVDGHGTDTKAFATSLQSLAMWRAMHGDAALAYGLGEAATRQKGHRYAGVVASKYVPDEHRMPLRNVVENGVRVSIGGIIDAPTDPRPALELIAEARAKGHFVPELIIPPCQLQPGTEGALPMMRCPHCHEQRGVA